MPSTRHSTQGPSGGLAASHARRQGGTRRCLPSGTEMISSPNLRCLVRKRRKGFVGLSVLVNQPRCKAQTEAAVLPEGASQEMEMVDTNASRDQQVCKFSEDYKQIYLSLTYSVILILGLPLNGTVLWLSWRQTKPWSCATIYLVNLMVADLLYVLTLPFLIITYSLGDRWPFGELLCRLVRFLFYTNLYGSILLLTCISAHRFLGVCHPLRSLPYRSRRHALLGTATTWALVVLQLLPTLFFSHTDYINGQMVCYDMTGPENFDQFFAYGMVLTLSGFALPSLVILVCYSLMVRSLIKPGETLRRTGNAARAKSIRTILLVCGLFTLCFVPFHITRSFYLTLRFLSSQDCQLLMVASMAYKIWRPLVSMSSCLNPVLYFLSVGNNRVRLLKELRHNKN
ncbi:P2Y purinoceptor 3-like [Lontra canadensis]|uniref:P2Y purinoceptor 3-like n=1 Tax=Lontra canadensis TaxID=76717 RepID=UPI0013F2F390|nr:P2Y purinoceptor 3-like [Lontra canadensis]